MGYAGSGAYPASYYAASAHPAPPRPALAGEVETDVCVVGAGYTGLSAGLDLAEKGYRVVALEGAKVGWGASGRNGGQIVNGLNASLETIAARYGKATADFVATVAQEGGRIMPLEAYAQRLAVEVTGRTHWPATGPDGFSWQDRRR